MIPMRTAVKRSNRNVVEGLEFESPWTQDIVLDLQLSCSFHLVAIAPLVVWVSTNNRTFGLNFGGMRENVWANYYISQWHIVHLLWRDTKIGFVRGSEHVLKVVKLDILTWKSLLELFLTTQVMGQRVHKNLIIFIDWKSSYSQPEKGQNTLTDSSALQIMW